MVKHPRRILAAGGAALALAAAPAHAEISDDVVKIGVLTDLTSLYSDMGGPGSVAAAKMAVEDMGGTVNGKDIKIISADHQNKTDVAKKIARKWIEDKNVDVIADLTNSAVAVAVSKLAAKHDTASLATGPATTALTNDACRATTVHYTFDTYAFAKGTGGAVVREGGKSWYFLTADYAFGHSLEQQTASVVKKNGGSIVGKTRHQLDNADFSSALLKAQGSGADVIGLANTGSDATKAIQQAKAFGISQGGQRVVSLLMFLTGIKDLGLETAQGLTLTTAFYWNQDDEARRFSDRFAKRMDGKRPTQVQAGTYSAVRHYLKAVAEGGSDAGEAAVDQMKAMPVNDFFAENAKIRADGRLVHDMYLVEVKSPEESQEAWDYYKVVRRIPGEKAYQPLSEGTCDLVN